MSLAKGVLYLSVLLLSVIILSGCFPTDEGTNNPIPVDPVITTDTTTRDKPSDLPINVNTTANTSDAGIDSMFNVLIQKTQSLEDVNSPAELYSLDFSSLRSGFGAAINNRPNHVKANVGFIVSSVLSINANKDLQKMVDSLDKYINDIDDYSASQNQTGTVSESGTLSKNSVGIKNFLSKTYAARGVLSTGQAIFAETPKVLMAQVTRPSFPRFVTMSYIQNLIESGVLPRLNEVIAATQRLESTSGFSLPITIDGENYEIDNGDILLLEGAVRAARAGFMMICIYNVDLYATDGSKDSRWIDEYYRYLDEFGNYQDEKLFYSLSGDTLYRTYYYDITSSLKTLSDIYSYNLQRPDFLSIRRDYHTAVYEDLKKVPGLIKAGITAIKTETDNQDDDVIPSADIFDQTTEMSEFSRDMIDDGFTPRFAANFQSPEALMDFISSVLTGPFTFNETVEDYPVNITVDLSKFFTNPAPSLMDYYPKYRIPSGNDRIISYGFSSSTYSSYSKSLYIYSDDYDSVIINIPSSMIESITPSTYDPESKTYTFKNYYRYTTYKDSMRMLTPIQFIDDSGNDIHFYEFVSKNEYTKETISKMFPYFKDYTFRGIFPAMDTRQKWVNFFNTFAE